MTDEIEKLENTMKHYLEAVAYNQSQAEKIKKLIEVEKQKAESLVVIGSRWRCNSEEFILAHIDHDIEADLAIVNMINVETGLRWSHPKKVEASIVGSNIFVKYQVVQDLFKGWAFKEILKGN